MNYFSYVLFIVSFLSFWKLPLMQFANGRPWLMLASAAVILLPVFVYRFYVRFRFVPDITITTDPLLPDPEPVAEGIAIALDMCKSKNKKVNLIISYAFGCNMTIKLHTGKAECHVEIQSKAGIVKYSIRTVPFSISEDYAVYSMNNNTNLLFVLYPPETGMNRVHIEALSHGIIRPFCNIIVSRTKSALIHLAAAGIVVFNLCRFGVL